MANLTRAEQIEHIDYERRETNAKFISADKTIRLLGRALKRILREPGIRTIPSEQNITALANTTQYAIDDSFKETISLWSGEGTANGKEFTYKPVDEYNSIVSGYVYTFTKRGFIDIKFPDITSLPSSSLKLRFWSKNIILDQDGVTLKREWENDDDMSALDEEYDDFYTEWCTANILRREGKAEWKDRLATAMEILGNLKEQSGSKSRRPSRGFGHYILGNR